MHSFVTSKNAQWPRLIWPTLYIVTLVATVAAKENCFEEPIKTIQHVRSSGSEFQTGGPA